MQKINFKKPELLTQEKTKNVLVEGYPFNYKFKITDSMIVLDYVEPDYLDCVVLILFKDCLYSPSRRDYDIERAKSSGEWDSCKALISIDPYDWWNIDKKTLIYETGDGKLNKLKDYSRVLIRSKGPVYEKISFEFKKSRRKVISYCFAGPGGGVERNQDLYMYRNISLIIPANCNPKEADYAKKALDLIAYTLQVNEAMNKCEGTD